MAYESKDIRNVAVVGHAGCGKTSFIENLLFKTKMTSRLGKVTEGSSILDVAPDEKSRQGTIDSAVAYLNHDGCHVNLIDTPGLLDFVCDGVGALAAVETVAVCVDAKSGPKVTTRRMWNYAKNNKLPRAIVVTRLDQPDTDFAGVVDAIQSTFGDRCFPLFVPNASGPDFKTLEATLTLSDSPSDAASAANESLVEAVVETDENLMERYLEGESISRDELIATMKKAFFSGELFPIIPVSAENGVGLDEVLKIFKDLLPSPLDVAHPMTVGEDTASCDPSSDKVSGLVFKAIQSDSGKLSFVRVMSGTLKSGQTLQNLTQEEQERGVQLFKIMGKDRSTTDQAVAGDIVAIPKADSLTIGDTVGDSGFEGRFLGASFPAPMVPVAIEPKSRGDASKLLDGLRRLAEETPTFQFEKDQITNDLVVRGCSQTHLDIMLKRLLTRSKIDVERHPPKIPYRETITIKGDAKYRHKKQSGGSGEFGEVWMRIEPNERDAGFEFKSEVVGGAISSSYMPSIEKGVTDTMKKGILAGCNIVDVRVIVYDGKEHAVDSKDVAFQKAGRGAFIEAFKKAKPIMLEPIVSVEVTVPSDNVGDVTTDLISSRRGQIIGTDYEGKYATIKANAALATILAGYDAQLRSMTAGEGSYSIEPSHYDQLPSNIQQQLVAENSKSE